MNEKSVCVQKILEKTNCARWPASHHLLWGGTRGREGLQVLLVKSGLPFLLLSLPQPSDMNLLAGCSWTNYWYFKEMLWWSLLFSLIHQATTSSFSSNTRAWTDYCQGISFHWTLGKKEKKKEQKTSELGYTNLHQWARAAQPAQLWKKLQRGTKT